MTYRKNIDNKKCNSGPDNLFQKLYAKIVVYLSDMKESPSFLATLFVGLFTIITAILSLSAIGWIVEFVGITNSLEYWEYPFVGIATLIAGVLGIYALIGLSAFGELVITGKVK